MFNCIWLFKVPIFTLKQWLIDPQKNYNRKSYTQVLIISINFKSLLKEEIHRCWTCCLIDHPIPKLKLWSKKAPFDLELHKQPWPEVIFLIYNRTLNNCAQYKPVHVVIFLIYTMWHWITVQYKPVDGGGGELHTAIVFREDRTLVDSTAVLAIAM